MTAKRLGALLIAVALVVGAIFLRDALNDDSSDADGPDASTPSSGAMSLVCSTEFRELCDSLGGDYAITIEPAGKTLDRLAKAQPADIPDAWLTLDPYPAMLDETRIRGNGLPAAVESSDILAVTDHVFSLPADRSEAFATACGTQSVAACVGQLAGTTWSDIGADVAGRVKPGIKDPATEAIGLLTFADGVAGFFKTTDINSNTWSLDTDFGDWMRNYTSNVGITAAGSPLTVMLVRASSVDVASTTSAEVTVTPRASGPEVGTLPVTPAFGTHAVLASLGSSRAGLASQLTDELAAQGWAAPAADEVALPASTFIALRQLWKDRT